MKWFWTVCIKIIFVQNNIPKVISIPWSNNFFSQTYRCNIISNTSLHIPRKPLWWRKGGLLFCRTIKIRGRNPFTIKKRIQLVRIAGIHSKRKKKHRRDRNVTVYLYNIKTLWNRYHLPTEHFLWINSKLVTKDQASEIPLNNSRNKTAAPFSWKKIWCTIFTQENLVYHFYLCREKFLFTIFILWLDVVDCESTESVFLPTLSSAPSLQYTCDSSIRQKCNIQCSKELGISFAFWCFPVALRWSNSPISCSVIPLAPCHIQWMKLPRRLQVNWWHKFVRKS